jgi:sugar O-acyltransferase (sialic acid O-acetyltransferase NeuD family)
MTQPLHKPIALIGYSGHAYVVYDVLLRMGGRVTAYCEQQGQLPNPHQLHYLGSEWEEAVLAELRQYRYFVAIGDNALRRKISAHLQQHVGPPLRAVDPSACISPSARLGEGVLVGPRAVINAFARLEEGVICNTGAIIEHECQLGAYVHLAPGAVLCGNVRIGAGSLIGANAVIRPGISIGSGACIGAGAVIVKDVGEGEVVVGNGRVL